MMQTDYLIRLFHEFIRKLLDFILKRDTETLELEPQVFSQGCSMLGVKEDVLLQMSAEEIITTFSSQNYALEKIELSAYLAYVKHQNEKAKELILYVNSRSNDFSIERQYLLDKLMKNEN